MAIANASDLQHLWSERAQFFGAEHAVMDALVNIYFGGLPPEFDDYFDPEMHVHLINMIRLAWDDLANLSGKTFPIYVEPDNNTPTARTRAEKVEKIGYGYNRAGRIVGGISKELLQKVIAWWMVGTGNAVVMALPDYRHKTPYFTFRDPRTHYPPVGWSPFTQAAASDALFAYQLTIGEIKRRYPNLRDEVSQKLNRIVSGRVHSARQDTDMVWVGEYYHEDCWVVATLTDPAVTLARSDSGDRGHPGVQPAVSMALYTPAGAKGRSMFADQVSIQAAMARMFSQRLDYFDRTLYPIIFHTRLAGQTIRIGPYATNEFDPTDGVPPRVDVVAPQNPVDADQSLAFAMGMSRMLNRNPEAMQGAGNADSAKALEALKSGVTSTIHDGIWPPMLEAEPRLYAKAAQMDVNLWGNVKKVAKGKRKNAAFSVNYVPAVDLRNYIHDFEVEAGLGLAGYQGTIEILQLLGAEQISEVTAIEQRSDIRDAEKELRRIQGDRIKKLIFADLAAKAQEGVLVPGALSEIGKRNDKGEDLFTILEDLEKRGQLYVVPPSPEADPLAALLGGGGGGGPAGPGGPPLPPPSLEAIQGGL